MYVETQVKQSQIMSSNKARIWCLSCAQTIWSRANGTAHATSLFFTRSTKSPTGMSRRRVHTTMSTPGPLILLDDGKWATENNITSGWWEMEVIEAGCRRRVSSSSGMFFTSHSYECLKYHIDFIATNQDRIALISIEVKPVHHFVCEPGVCSTLISRALVFLLYFVSSFFSFSFLGHTKWKLGSSMWFATSYHRFFQSCSGGGGKSKAAIQAGTVEGQFKHHIL